MQHITNQLYRGFISLIYAYPVNWQPYTRTLTDQVFPGRYNYCPSLDNVYIWIGESIFYISF